MLAFVKGSWDDPCEEEDLATLQSFVKESRSPASEAQAPASVQRQEDVRRKAARGSSLETSMSSWGALSHL